MRPAVMLSFLGFLGFLGGCLGDDVACAEGFRCFPETSDSTGASAGSSASASGGDTSCLSEATASGLVGSCTYTDAGLSLCKGIYGGADAASEETACTTMTGDGDGTWSTDPCTTTGLAGSCLVKDGGQSVQLLHFYDTSEGETRCMSLGDVGSNTAQWCPA